MSRSNPARSAALLLAAPLALALAACGNAREPQTVNDRRPHSVVDSGAGESCNAKAAEQYVGQVLDEALAERARASAGARGVRVIRPGMAVTMDHRAGRLNIELDDAGRILRVRCG